MESLLINLPVSGKKTKKAHQPWLVGLCYPGEVNPQFSPVLLQGPQSQPAKWRYFIYGLELCSFPGELVVPVAPVLLAVPGDLVSPRVVLAGAPVYGPA